MAELCVRVLRPHRAQSFQTPRRIPVRIDGNSKALHTSWPKTIAVHALRGTDQTARPPEIPSSHTALLSWYNESTRKDYHEKSTDYPGLHPGGGRHYPLKRSHLFPDHPEYHEELASLAVSLGRDTSLEQVRCQGRRYYGGYRVSLSLPKEEFQLWKDRFKENLPEDRLSSISPTGTAPTSASANSPAGRKNRKMVTFPTYRAVPAFSSPGAA